MLIYLPRLENGPFVDTAVNHLETLARVDRVGEHELTDDPTVADVILFPQCHMVDWRLQAIRKHHLTRSFWEKVMIYDERDRTWPSFPGVYVSMPKRRFDCRFQRAWSYMAVPEAGDIQDDADLLFSFVGSPSSPCRTPLFALHHAESVVEEVQDFMFWDESSPAYSQRRSRYQEILSRSRFVLCPRGRGTSTFRLYEALAAGRVPVIISDDWIPPDGPNWDSFSIRWPEGRTEDLVAMLEERDAEWPAMSVAAKSAHRAFFDTDVAFHQLINACQRLLESPTWRPATRAGIRRRGSVAVCASLPARLRTTMRLVD